MSRIIVPLLLLFLSPACALNLPTMDTYGHLTQNEADELLEETKEQVLANYREGIDRAADAIATLDERNRSIKLKLDEPSTAPDEAQKLLAEYSANQAKIVEFVGYKQQAADGMRLRTEQLISSDAEVLTRIAAATSAAAQAEVDAQRAQRALPFGWFAGVFADDPVYDRMRADARQADAHADQAEAFADLTRAQADTEEGFTLSDLWDWLPFF
ncbi:MAG: hypothetical protein KDD66_08745 [Bdellovibrionales bacterium]|nr:hypothetical protein [Bdellovibrionales bacterium]